MRTQMNVTNAQKPRPHQCYMVQNTSLAMRVQQMLLPHLSCSSRCISSTCASTKCCCNTQPVAAHPRSQAPATHKYRCISCTRCQQSSCAAQPHTVCVCLCIIVPMRAVQQNAAPAGRPAVELYRGAAYNWYCPACCCAVTSGHKLCGAYASADNVTHSDVATKCHYYSAPARKKTAPASMRLKEQKGCSMLHCG
jgi:hypothetical protein